jgi:hypothetical protein
MNDVIVFSVGAVVFVATSSATLIWGYLRFSALQQEDADASVEA